MKLYIFTDIEGVSGVLNFDDYCNPDSRYYEMGKRLLTAEVNAACKGFFEGGVDEITVIDGHGHGAINQELLDPRVNLSRGHYRPIWPWGMDEGYDAIAYIGQHAKSNSPYSHLTHTGMPSCFETTVNGLPIGEYGQGALCAMELGIPAIFAAGEKAFTEEAEELTPGVVTVWGKRGLVNNGRDPNVTTEEYWKTNLAAEHVAIGKVHAMLTEKAREAAIKWHKDPTQFHYPDLHGPWTVRRIERKPSKDSPVGMTYLEGKDDKSFIAALNAMFSSKLLPYTGKL